MVCTRVSAHESGRGFAHVPAVNVDKLRLNRAHIEGMCITEGPGRVSEEIATMTLV